MDKIKVLMYCDSPTAATGFGTVIKNICEYLHKTGRFDINILGINYWGDPHDFPYKIWPVCTHGHEHDPYGRKKVFNMIQKMDFDILFFLQDSFILDFVPNLIKALRNNNKKFKSIAYIPVDSVPRKEWVANLFGIDYLVAYTQFGKKQLIKQSDGVLDDNVRVIYHGVNTTDFNYIADKKLLSEVRERSFGRHKDKFIVINVNRNQKRKDIPRTITVFKEFKKQVPNSVLYLHMAEKDYAGWDIAKVCDSFDMKTGEDVVLPDFFNPSTGLPIYVLNVFLNISDVFLTTTLGEGCGLTHLEALATKTPIIVPDNTAITEMVTDDIGFKVRSGGDLNLYTMLTGDGDILRPLTDINDAVEKLLYIYNNRDEAKAKADAGYKYVLNNMDWGRNIVPQWFDLFTEAYDSIGKVNQHNVSGDKNYIKAELF